MNPHEKHVRCPKHPASSNRRSKVFWPIVGKLCLLLAFYAAYIAIDTTTMYYMSLWFVEPLTELHLNLPTSVILATLLTLVVHPVCARVLYGKQSKLDWSAPPWFEMFERLAYTVAALVTIVTIHIAILVIRTLG